MGLTNVFDYLWVIENTASHVEVALHIFPGGAPKTWRRESELGPI